VSRIVLVGDVKNKIAILVDDMTDTCRTLVKAAETVIDHGAREVVAIVTYSILSRNAIETLNKGKLSKVVVTNTVPTQGKMEACIKLEILCQGLNQYKTRDALMTQAKPIRLVV